MIPLKLGGKYYNAEMKLGRGSSYGVTCHKDVIFNSRFRSVVSVDCYIRSDKKTSFLNLFIEDFL